MSIGVKVMLDKERELLMTLGTAKRFKEKTGKDMPENPTEDDMRYILWACLAHHEDKDLKVEDVDDLISSDNVDGLIEAFKKLVERSTKGKSELPLS